MSKIISKPSGIMTIDKAAYYVKFFFNNSLVAAGGFGSHKDIVKKAHQVRSQFTHGFVYKCKPVVDDHWRPIIEIISGKDGVQFTKLPQDNKRILTSGK